MPPGDFGKLAVTDFELASRAIAAVSAFGIWRGIAAMIRANKERAAALEQQRAAGLRRHAEAMAVLETLFRGVEAVIERTAPAATSGSV